MNDTGGTPKTLRQSLKNGATATPLDQLIDTQLLHVRDFLSQILQTVEFRYVDETNPRMREAIDYIKARIAQKDEAQSE